MYNVYIVHTPRCCSGAKNRQLKASRPGCQDAKISFCGLCLYYFILLSREVYWRTHLLIISLWSSLRQHCATTYIHQPLPAQFSAALAALYLPFVFVFVFVVVFGATLEFGLCDMRPFRHLISGMSGQKLTIRKVENTKS